MNTQEYCEYVSKQPTNVDFDISAAYYKGLETTTELPPRPVQVFAKRFAKEHETDMFAFDSLGGEDESWILWITPASNHIFVVHRFDGREVLSLVERLEKLPEN
jgi:hypothetical protein